jgi:Tfp pilus assembly protein PilN
VIRVNLLPPEVLQKRKYERFWGYLILGAVMFYVVLAAVAGVLYYMSIGKSVDVANKEQEAASLQVQAEQFKVFEDRQTSLEQRQAVVEQALTDRVAWSKLLTELSLVLPSDVWFESMTVDEKTVTVEGNAVDHLGDPNASGFKAVAKLLARLGDMREFENLWLTSSSRQHFLGQPTIHFTLSADVQPKASAADSAPPEVP